MEDKQKIIKEKLELLNTIYEFFYNIGDYRTECNRLRYDFGNNEFRYFK